MKLSYARIAAAEVDALLTYLAERSPPGAERVSARIKQAEQALLEHPHIGQLTSARRSRVRRFIVQPYPYAMFYQVSDTTIFIVAVRHTARDPSSEPWRS